MSTVEYNMFSWGPCRKSLGRNISDFGVSMWGQGRSFGTSWIYLIVNTKAGQHGKHALIVLMRKELPNLMVRISDSTGRTTSSDLSRQCYHGWRGWQLEDVMSNNRTLLHISQKGHSCQRYSASKSTLSSGHLTSHTGNYLIMCGAQ